MTYNAVDADGATLYSDFIPVSVIPAMPASLSASTVTEDSVTLQWTADSDLATSYRIEVSQEGAPFTVVADGVTRDGSTGFFVPPVTPSFVSGPFAERIYYGIGDLAVGTHYTFHVLATNAAGSSTVASLEVQTVGRQATSGTLHPRPESDPLPPSAAWAADLGFNINFYGLKARELLVVNNGKLTWAAYGLIPWQDEPDPAHAGFLMAPFYTPADTYHTNEMKGGNVTFGPETYEVPGEAYGRKSFAVHWNGVSFYNESWDGDPQVTGPNTFSAIIVERSDTGPGNFDIIYKYGDLNWDGQLTRTGGQTTLAYSPRAGYFYEQLSGSGEDGGLLYLANTSITKEVRNPTTHIELKDLAPGGGTITDIDKKILGVTHQAYNSAHLRLTLNTDADPALNVHYSYEIYGPIGLIPYAPLENSIDYSTSINGRYTITVKNDLDDDFQESVEFYVTDLWIQWKGANTKVTTYDQVNSDDYISNKTIDIFSGQPIILDYSVDLPNIQIVQLRWLVGNTDHDVKGFNISGPIGNSQNTGHAIPLRSKDFGDAKSNRNDQMLKMYAVDDAHERLFTFKLRAMIGSRKVEFSTYAHINVHKPGQSIWNEYFLGPLGIPIRTDLFKVTGKIDDYPQMKMNEGVQTIQGIANWSTTIPGTDKTQFGEICYVQLMKAFQWRSSGLLMDTDGTYGLDTSYPYDASTDGFTPGDVFCGDGPYVGWSGPLDLTLFMQMYGQDWLMWKAPSPDSIFIPIQRFEWSLIGVAEYDSLLSKWNVTVSLGHGTSIGPEIIGTDTSMFPDWTKRVSARSWIP